MSKKVKNTASKSVNKIVAQKLDIDVKAKEIVFTSIKLYANNKKVVHTTKRNKATLIKALKACKDRKEYMSETNSIVSDLSLDSKAKKENVCKNTQYCVLADKLSRKTELDKFAYAVKAKK